MECAKQVRMPSPLAIDGWQRMVKLTGLGGARPVNGWDRLVRALFEAPEARIMPGRRIEAIALLLDALTHLKGGEFEVLVLRYGVTIDDRATTARSRREVSMKLELSHSRIAQLERSGLDSLRQQLGKRTAKLQTLVDLQPGSC